MPTKFIQSYQDLQTPHEIIKQGFLAQASTKTERALPYLQNAQAFYHALQAPRTIEEIIALSEVKDDLIAACGFSDKARKKLTEEELDQSIKKVLVEIQKLAGKAYKEDIFYRYLLTRGDSFGGSMRNFTGAQAGIKLVDLIAERLKNRGDEIEVLRTPKGKMQRIAWTNRVLRFDVKPKFIGKNIDVILLKSEKGLGKSGDKELLENKSSYLACGELKGGIDPAGADEHWKTANTALGRIREAFDKPPSLFFMGAAIEASMAREIYGQLQDGRMTYAANFNHEKQLGDLIDWLISL